MARCDGCTTWRHFQTQASPNPSALLLSTPGRRGSRNVRSINASSTPSLPPVCLSESVWFNSRTSSKCRCRGAGGVGRGRGHGTPLPLALPTSPPCRFSRIRCVISQACDRPALVQGQLLNQRAGEGERLLNMTREAGRH